MTRRHTISVVTIHRRKGLLPEGIVRSDIERLTGTIVTATCGKREAHDRHDIHAWA